jgi:cell division protein FtsQ
VRALGKGDRVQANGFEPGLRLHAMPKPLRLGFRVAQRFLRGDVRVPQHLGKSVLGGFMAATIAYGTWLGGHLPGLIDETSNQAGLSVNAIRITGHQRTTQEEVLAALNFGKTPSIIGLDVEAARARLLALPWVTSASVAKALPGAVSVELTEKQAMAIWQNGSETVVLDEKGSAIGPARLAGDRALPAFVGKGANVDGFEFAALVRVIAPSVSDKVRVHIRVADRRWDLLMDNGVTVKLPEERREQALIDLEQMQAASDILGRDITTIDLRVAGRPTVGLGEVAVAALITQEDDAKAKKAKP